MKKSIIAVLLLLTACKKEPVDIPSGSIYKLPLCTMYAIGTDSTIVIIDRDNGEITAVIDRKGYVHE